MSSIDISLSGRGSHRGCPQLSHEWAGPDRTPRREIFFPAAEGPSARTGVSGLAGPA
ncbi:MAG: hypothetical protein ABJD68_08000 [Nakamurella sp.]